MPKDKEGLARKYDQGAGTYSTCTYADPESVARRQVNLVRRWGPRMGPGASVLELACADGFVTAELVRAGFRVTAVDISPRMIEVASQRLGRDGLRADLRVADMEEFVLVEAYDVTTAIMRTFFHYADEPGSVLRQLAEHTKTKILVDVNPRETNLRSALEMVQQAGFESVSWRPFFVPQRLRVGQAALYLLRRAERVPVLREAVVRRKFHVIIKGEKARPGGR